MFLLHPPATRPFEVFTRMPDRFRRAGERSVWARANMPGRQVDAFLEGPVAICM